MAAVENDFKTVLSKVKIALADINPDVHLDKERTIGGELGLDSLDLIDLQLSIEDLLGEEIMTRGEFAKACSGTIEDLVNAIVEARRENEFKYHV